MDKISVFKEIANDNKDIKNTLLDDIKNIYKEGIIERIDDWILWNFFLFINSYFEIRRIYK